jgi:2,3-bisphosphoglycerate-independent phosphoglycerate mutase
VPGPDGGPAFFRRTPPNQKPARRDAHGAGHAVAIEVELLEARRADVRARIHFNTVNDRKEIVFDQRVSRNRFRETFKAGRHLPGVKRVDIFTPRCQHRQLVARHIAIGDIVDRATKGINLEHRLTLLAAENAHGEIERTAARARGRRAGVSGLLHLCGHCT